MEVIVARNARRYFPSSFTMALVVAVFLGTPSAVAAEDKAEYEFANVENLPLQKGLPDPFLMPDGKRVQNTSRLAEAARVYQSDAGALPVRPHAASAQED